MRLSYTLELKHPNNRILVDYGKRTELVLLAAFHKNGTEMFPLPANLAMPAFSMARTFSGAHFNSIKSLAALRWLNAEG